MKHLRMSGKSNATFGWERERGPFPGKGAGIGSKASGAGSSILSVAAAREERGFTLASIECFSYFPRLLLNMFKHHYGLQKDNDCPKSSPSFFSTHEVIYMIMAFSI